MGNSAVKEHRLKNHPNREAKSTRGVHKSEHGDDDDDDEDICNDGNDAIFMTIAILTIMRIEYGMTDDDSLIVM